MSAPVTLKRPPKLTDHNLGSLDSSIMIVGYFDFECPRSAEAISVLDAIQKKYQDVCLILRHFPVAGLHHNAGIAAVASEAAAKQGKFWEMARALLENQGELESEKIFLIARELKLDMKRFLNDLEDDELFEKVQEDFKGGVETSVEKTPTLFINGIQFDEGITLGQISDEIDEIQEEDHQPHP